MNWGLTEDLGFFRRREEVGSVLVLSSGVNFFLRFDRVFFLFFVSIRSWVLFFRV